MYVCKMYVEVYIIQIVYGILRIITRRGGHLLGYADATRVLFRGYNGL